MRALLFDLDTTLRLQSAARLLDTFVRGFAASLAQRPCPTALAQFCSVGDEAENDYFAVRAAELQAIWREGLYTATGEMPEHELSEPRELLSYLPPRSTRAAAHQLREYSLSNL